MPVLIGIVRFQFYMDGGFQGGDAVRRDQGVSSRTGDTSLISSPQGVTLFRRWVKNLLGGTKKRGVILENLTWWFFAAERIEDIPYDIVFETGIHEFFLREDAFMGPPREQLRALRILEYLTACPGVMPPVLLSHELFSVVVQIIRETSDEAISQHCLLIIIQVIEHLPPEQISGEFMVELFRLAELKFSMESESVRGLATYLICVCCFSLANVEAMNALIGQVFSCGEALPVVMLLKGMRHMLPLCPAFASCIDATGFIAIVLECAVRMDIYYELFRAFRCFLGCWSHVIATSGVTELIVQFLSVPNLKKDVFSCCGDFILALLDVPEAIGRMKEVVQALCGIAENGTFELRRIAVRVLGEAIGRYPREFMRVSIECGLVEVVVDIFDSGDEDFALGCLKLLKGIFDSETSFCTERFRGSVELLDRLSSYAESDIENSELCACIEALLAFVGPE